MANRQRLPFLGSYGAVLVLAVVVINAKESCFDVNSDKSIAEAARKNACGVSKALQPDSIDRIMGGTNAELGEFPWMARLYYRSKNDTDPMCGGSLIHEQYILTAAHCCSGDFNMELMFVRLGEYDASTYLDCSKGRCAPQPVDIEVDEIINYDEYNPLQMVNDICIIRLKKEVEFTDYIYPICLPVDCKMQQHKFEHNTLTAAGWGINDEVPGNPLYVLQKLKVATVEKSTCEKMWKEEEPKMKIRDSQICAGKEVGQDVCSGDSGGPLMYKSSISGRSRLYVVGLVSYGQPCANRNSTSIPGIYTNVASFLPWIFNTITDSS